MVLPADVYLQPDAPDPVLTEEQVLRLVRKHAPATWLRQVDESGGEARAYFVDDDIVLKVQRPHRLRARTSLEKEAFFLDLLAEYPELSVPRVLGYGRDAEVEYICMTRMPGSAVRRLTLEGSARAEVLRELGRSLRLLHSVDQNALLASGLLPGDRSPDDFRDRLQRGFERAVAAAASLDEWPLPVSPDDIAGSALSGLVGQPVLVGLHSNPGPEHAFVDPESLRFTGLIDFGDAYISHPAFDLRWPRSGDRTALLEGYRDGGSLDDGFRNAVDAIFTLTDLSIAVTPRWGEERRAQALANLKEAVDQL